MSRISCMKRMSVSYNASMRICFVGDSFVNGTGDPDCLGWAGRVCATARTEGKDITYYNLGIRRDTSADIAARWYREMAPRLPAEFPSLVVFSFGANDTTEEGTGTRVRLNESVEHLRAILATATRDYRVSFVGPAPVADPKHNGRTALLSGTFARVCAEFEVPYLDVLQPLEASSVWMEEVIASDGAHPGARGYSIVASLVGSWEAWRSCLR